MQTRVSNPYLNSNYSQYGTSRQQKAETGSVLRGRVVDNNDPLSLGRIKVRIPLIHGDGLTSDSMSDSILPWCVVAHMSAGAGGGSFLTPKVNDTVIVVFESGDWTKPIAIGCVYGTDSCTSMAVGNTLGSQMVGTTATSKVRTIAQPETPLEGHDVNHDVLFKSINGSVQYFDNTTNNDNITLIGANKEEMRLGNVRCNMYSAGRHMLILDDEEKYATLKSFGGFQLLLDDKNKQALLTNLKKTQQIIIDDKKNEVRLKHKENFLQMSDESTVLKHGSSELDLTNDGFNLHHGSAKVSSSGSDIVISSGGSKITVSASGEVTVDADVFTVHAGVINLGD